MKFRTSTLIIVLALPILCHAQPYQKLVLENAHWTTIAYLDGVTDVFGYSIQGDTIAGGTPYKKVYFLDLLPDEFAGPYYIEDKRLFGLIREDTVARKVYAITFEAFGNENCPVEEEFLLYDFSKGLNDTLDECINTVLEDYPLVIDSVDYADLWGAERRRLMVNRYITNGEALIEGLGYNTGLFLEGIFYPHTLNWFVSLYDYCVGTEEECGLITGVQEVKKKNMRLFPNPAGEAITIELDRTTPRALHLRLLNHLGQPVGGRSLPPYSERISWDVSGLPAGLYFIEARMGGETPGIRKFIKSR